MKVTGAVADISSPEAVKTAFTGFGDVHLLINNAGVSRHPTPAVTDPAAWEDEVASNPTVPTRAPMRCCRRRWRAIPARSSM